MSAPDFADEVAERERLAQIADELADEEHNSLVEKPPGTWGPHFEAHLRRREADFRAIAKLLRERA